MTSLAILHIIRVHIVAGGVLAFSLGALLAILNGGNPNPLHLALGYCVVFLGDLSTHFSNDYFDVESDKQLTTKKLFSNKKILVKNPKLSSLIKKIALTLLGMSNVLAALIVVFFGAPTEFFVISFFANLLGLIYSAPPIRLSSNSFGELAIALATGFIIPSIGYLSVKNQLNPLFLYLAIPFMLYGFFLSLNLEAPDIKNDEKGQKSTLAVRVGPKNIFYIIMTNAALVSSVFFVLLWSIPSDIIDMQVVFFLSLLPLAATITGFLFFFKDKNLHHFSSLNIVSIFLFIISLNVYFAALL